MNLPKCIHSVVGSSCGFLAIYGDIGYRRYLYYTKREAMRRYAAECNAQKCK